MKALTKTGYLRRIIAGKGYNLSRMAQMDRDVYYLECSQRARNRALREAFVSTAKMYLKRYQYYFQNELRKSI